MGKAEGMIRDTMRKLLHMSAREIEMGRELREEYV